MKDLGPLVLAVILVAGPLMLLRATVARAAAHSGNGRIARTARAASLATAPRHIRAAGRVKAAEVWEAARAADWLEGRRHARELTPAPATAEQLAGDRPPADIDGTWLRDGPGQPWYQNVRGRRVQEAELRRIIADESDPGGLSDPPWTARNTPPPPSTANGGNTDMAAGTSTASAEKLIDGTNEIHARAVAGGIYAKQDAIKASHEGAVRFSAMEAMLARTLSDRNYGPEITEPLAKAAQHLQAAAMCISESDAALSTLIHMSVGDLAGSPRQAPHHTELTESGAH